MAAKQNTGSPVIAIRNAGFQWPVLDPFLFCAHHLDSYPRGNGRLGPEASLSGRNIGNDFQGKDGWRMYHGQQVPGFPAHPHRGFETVTITLNGLIDHFDSHGGAGRYGNGDVQWMTAGKGIQHAEMFPLTRTDEPNTLELFQVWLNLPAKSKMVSPYYAMHWNEDIPVYLHKDKQGKKTEVKIIAGRAGGISALSPAPDSWAADPGHEVAILLIHQHAGAVWTLPAAGTGTGRMLFLFRGGPVLAGDTMLNSGQAAQLASEQEVRLENQGEESYFLYLQGRPVQEPVYQYGPFVMNSEEEIRQTFEEFRRTSFGGWPWPSAEPAHPAGQERFASYSDGRKEYPGKKG
ncbi:MAG: pirin family protein [Bacteroidota bacterium]